MLLRIYIENWVDLIAIIGAAEINYWPSLPPKTKLVGIEIMKNKLFSKHISITFLNSRCFPILDQQTARIIKAVQKRLNVLSILL